MNLACARHLLLGIVLITAAACHGGSDATDLSFTPDLAIASDLGDLGDSDLAPFTPVVAPPLPIIPKGGGPIIASPQIVTMTWQSDPIAAGLEAFDDWQVTSATWKDVMAEWGVGPGTHAGKYRSPDPAPATLDEAGIGALIDAAVTQALIPAPSPSVIYTIYPPAGTVVSQGGSFHGCVEFQAYHFQATVQGKQAFFAVTPRCANTAGMSALDFTTWGMSHEVMEAASDPDFQMPAWLIQAQTPTTPELGENADLCVGHPMKVDGHEITRNYSNVAAMKGARPCVPAPDGPMFGVFPDPAEVTLPAGGKATVKIRFYSSAPLAPFGIAVQDRTTQLTVALDRNKGQNGDVATLTISAPAGYVEQPGGNLVDLEAISGGYLTRRDLVVHAP